MSLKEVGRLSLRERRETTMKRVAVVSLTALLALHGPIAAPSASPATASLTPTSAPRESQDRVSVTLDLREPLLRGRLAHAFQHSGSRSTVGAARVCLHADCPPPCPCSGPMAAASFDIDDRGRLWVVDSAKMRVSVFRRDSTLAFARRQPGRSPSASYDLQVQGDRVVVGHAGEGVYLIEGRTRSDLKPIRSLGRAVYNSGTWFHVDDSPDARFPPSLPPPAPQGGIFMDLDEIEDDVESDFGFAEIFPSPGLPHAEAREAPGHAPFRDGWLKTTKLPDRPMMRLKARSTDHSWNLKIRARTIGPRNGLGFWGYEYEVAEDGTVHLLLRTGSQRLHSWWYLKVSYDGEVGTPRHIYQHRPRGDVPTASDQLRHISLDSRGRPFVMWATPKRTTVRQL